jgi:hypothetical protein
MSSHATAIRLANLGLIIGHEDILLFLADLTLGCYARSILLLLPSVTATGIGGRP